jgi:hypothetical protein
MRRSGILAFVIAVLWWRVGDGVFLVGWGIALAVLGKAGGRSAELNRGLSETRWKALRFVDWRVLSGRIQKDDWVERDARAQRAIAQWALLPGGVLCAAAGIFMAVQGVLGVSP